MLYAVIFCFIALILVVLFLVKIRTVIEYVRNDDDDNFVLSFYTMKGVFKYKYEIPLVDLGKKGVKFKLVKELGRKDRVLEKSKERLKIGEVYEKYVFIREYYEANKVLICDIRDYLKTRLILAEFNLYMKEGTGNASHTGIICGLLWSLTGIFTSLLSDMFTAFEKKVTIVPDFNRKVFIVDFYCIFHIKLVHIIVVAMKIYFNVMNKKQEMEKEVVV